MLALALLASHLVGDFVFQTRWQASGKFGWASEAVALRSRHACAYAVAFAPVVYWRLADGVDPWRVASFLWALLVLHFLTDAQRFTSTLGDFVGWWCGRPGGIVVDEARRRYDYVGSDESWEAYDDLVARRLRPLPANPWPSLPLVLDQTLHVVQLAALGWLLT